MAADFCTWVGRRIRTLRAERGWTQAMLADHEELAREYVSEIENGEEGTWTAGTGAHSLSA